MPNPFILPKVHTQSREINQIQNNVEQQVNKALQPLHSATAANYIVGEVKSAFLTETQFQDQAGVEWVLCDGRDCKGSAYQTLTGNTTIPDMRGTVPRMMDNGAGIDPAGDLPLGTYEADEYKLHNHSVTDPGHIHQEFVAQSTGGGILQVGGQGNGNGVHLATTDNTGSSVTGISIVNSGSAETRAKSTILNFFIRIN